MNPHHPDILPQHAQRDIAFKQALSVWAKQHRSRGDRGRQTQVRLQRLAASLAIPVVIGGTAGYMRLSSPTPVSAAEALLHRATHALRAASPNQAIHAIYAVAGDGGGAATLDEWVQPDANGGIAQGAITTQDNAGHIQDRTILSGEQATTYNAVANTIVQAAVDQVGLPNPLDAAALTQYIQTAQQGGGAGIHLLASTTIDGHSVAAVGIQQPNNETAALYIDKQSSIIRKFDLTRDGDPQPLVSLHLVAYEEAPLSSVPAPTFTLNAPSSAHAVVSPDGSSQMGTQHVSMAQAVALPNRPSILLSGDAGGLRLNDVRYVGTPTASFVNYIYALSPTKVLGVNIVTEEPGVSPLSDRRFSLNLPTSTATSSLTLTIAGQTVQALYSETPNTSNGPISTLLYSQSGVGVRIGSVGLSKDEFFQAVKALVDGHTNPALVEQLQHELDTSTPLASPPRSRPMVI